MNRERAARDSHGLQWTPPSQADGGQPECTYPDREKFRKRRTFYLQTKEEEKREHSKTELCYQIGTSGKHYYATNYIE